MVEYPHLHLIEWPFRMVPNERSCCFMGDRVHLRAEVKALLQHLSVQPASSIHLMWAWFGAGKTHTLKHMAYLCKDNTKNIIPIYIEFPRSVKGFLDIYKAFISNLDVDLIDEAYVDIFGDATKEKIQRELRQDYPDLANALKLHFMGQDEQQDIVVRWLRAECKETRILKTVGIMRPIQTVEDAIKIIVWIVRLINLNNKSAGGIKRVVWMLDEFQLIELLRKPAADEINSCLHSIFNSCPDGLSIIVSFSGYPDQKLPSWLSSEIKDRLDKRPLLLPCLTKEEALVFIGEILEHFRDPSAEGVNKYFPFTKDAVETVICSIIDCAKQAKRHDEPKPRTLMQFFNTVLQEAEPLLKDKEMTVIDKQFSLEKIKGIGLD